jgi:hypothetical protein
MWRAFFLAIGIFLIILGFESLGVARVTLKIHDEPAAPVWPFETQPKIGAAKQLVPPPWAPWTLLSTGSIVCIYSFTLPKRVAGQ